MQLPMKIAIVTNTRLYYGIIFYWRPTKDFNVKFGTAYQVKANHFDLLKINSVEKSSLGYWFPILTSVIKI
jgi:hypothetical protein